MKQSIDINKGVEYFEHEPFRCGLFEVMFGEISNYHIRMYDYELAKKYKPDIFTFTENDVLMCHRFVDLPEDWQRYALACIEKYFE